MTLTPAPGTKYADRRKQLDVMSFMDVRYLATATYQVGDAFLCDIKETVAINQRPVVKQKVLDYELTNHMILPDGSELQQPQQQSGGEQPMALPFNPGAPNGAPPQQSMPAMQPMAPQQLSMPGAPYGMPAAGGPPQVFTPPGSPPPVASPAQAAGVPQEQLAAPAAGGKKKRGAGASVAPPPAPPPTNPGLTMAQPMPVMSAPGMAPQPGFAPPGFTPVPQQIPQVMAAQPQPMQQPMQQPAHQPQAQIDLGPVTTRIDELGKVVNGVAQLLTKEIETLHKENIQLKAGLNIAIGALHHLYVVNEKLAPSLAGKDVGEFGKFIAYLQQYLPQ